VTAEGERARLAGLRLALLDAHPFWGFLLMHLTLVPDASLSHIAATDARRHIWFNPHRTAALSDAQLAFVLLHEVGHLAYASAERARGRDHYLWNRATDYAINRMIVAASASASASDPDPDAPATPLCVPPPGILLDRRFDGLLAEAIYERLLDEARGEGSGPLESVGDHRGASHGGGLDLHLPPTPAEGAFDDGVDGADAVAARLRAATEHWIATGRRGHVPGELARPFEPGRGVVPWVRELRAFVQTAVTLTELDPWRPDRRWLARDVYRPGRGGDHLGCVVVALDTSGSIPREMLAMAGAELMGLRRVVDEVYVVVADARVQESIPPEQVEAWLRRGRMRGGGGTDHRPVFEWVARRGLQPDAFIGFTDLQTRFPDFPPPYPVLWIAPGGAPRPPFGRVVVIA
jgi:predicted metal-dependent peptidase